MTLTEAIITAGFSPPPEINIGRITRFSTNGKKSDRAGWVYLFPDEQGAAFGCNRTKQEHVWQADHDKPLTREEQAELKRKWQEAKQAANAERSAGYQAAAVEALKEWERANSAPGTHPYLVKKGIRPNMARVDSNGCLLIPVYGADNSLQSVQRIAPDGQKRFLKGGKMQGGHCWLSEPENDATLILCEGFATADSLHRATGYAVCVAFSAGNLKSVAEHIRKRYPKARLIIAADNDLKNPNHNTGVIEATKAAQATGASVVIPDNGGDFNDLAQAQGLEAVRVQVEQSRGELMTNRQPAFKAPALSGTDSRDGTENTRPLSELGNAQRLLDVHSGNIHYVNDAKAWLHWQGGAWAWDVDGARTRALAARLPEQIYLEGGQYLNDAMLFAKWARTSQKEFTINSAVSLLSDFEPVRLPLALVDADLLKVGIDRAKQVIDLTTGITRPARQSDFITKSLNVNEVGSATKAIRWRAFLGQIFGDDNELIDWLKRLCGYLLTGSTSEQIFVFCFGMGANGKSVLAETVRYILGDYARAISSETLTEQKRAAGSASPDLAELIGARLAMSSETEDGAALAESLIKSLVAGDTMTARRLYSAPVQFQPQFKLLMLGNHKPVIKGNDYGIWRRVRLIPFNRTFQPEERDPQLLDKLKAESPHILAWMVEGCQDWQKRSLSDIPATIRQATGDYQEEQDLIGRWLSECCKLSPSYEESTTEIYKNYQQWCTDNGLRPCSNVALGRRLSERGFNNKRTRDNRLWEGLAIGQATYADDYRAAKGW